jgi:polyhydroxybutyrate depolymerase
MPPRVSSYVFLFAALLHVSLAADKPKEVKPRPSNGTGGSAGVFANETIEVNGQQRHYRLVVPAKIDPQTPAPLLFAFHGFLIDSKDLMPMYTRLDKLAAEKGFVLVYPNALNRGWPLVPLLAKRDVAFFDALLQQLGAKYNIDLNRVYLAGMSNGGYFTHVVASQRSDQVAAIACHSGGLGLIDLSSDELKHKYAVLIVHGALDSIVNVEEGRKARDAYEKQGHPVKYVEVPRLNHLWATRADINHTMWDFFAEHPLESQDR